jgi:hypothetical protein
VGIQTNHTETLAAGEMCVIKVDGSQGNAHVIFDDSTTLGVIAWEDYRVGNAI